MSMHRERLKIIGILSFSQLTGTRSKWLWGNFIFDTLNIYQK
ncbi:uncharacterized protein CELE_Y22F5A.11 [Caenorhabditis elegans]|uniref:Uncharacterized protein n=1 Tax=Caenorhabditis elegans TaxID=6239 RepID=F3Y5P1_CAEEL|nr:Uncharacterized protein CELE_Y22F5A.11 [Caenorhabditis elegans]CCA65638.1 Uncharacterized protein CELE_Y22F5A.11 [Caenorhabditis elegans]|eukprot:NP_001256203.1 Uncharacterized protein CELE_Y22F5A.11 [Caenorhabditis elegans]